LSTATATLIVRCPDQKGLVAALSQLLYRHGANILRAQQHTEPSTRTFCQRIHFETADLGVARHELERILAEECTRLHMDWRLSYSDQRKRVAIFVSKFEHCLSDLLLRHRLGELPCEMVGVISNHPDLSEVADKFGLPFHLFAITKDTKREQEQRELALLAQLGVDLVVLARYMQILSPEFIDALPERIINIHHSFLPAFIGARPYHQAYERGVKLIGATAHYATSDLDEGPILTQRAVDCSHYDTVADLIRKGRDVERIALAGAVRAHLEDRVAVVGHRTVVF